MKNFDMHPKKENEMDKDALEFERYVNGMEELSTVELGQQVTGTVLTLGADVAIVDIGAKSEAYVKLSEFTEPDGTCTLQVGQPVTAYVVGIRPGEVALSRALSQSVNSVDMLYEAHAQGIPVEAHVSGASKGGLTLKIFNKRAFMPISQIEMGFVEDLNSYIGKNMLVKITEVSDGGNNIVVSRRKLLKEEAEAKAERTLERLNPGDLISGTISNVVEYGAFVDIGGLEGLVHISELDWDHVTNAKEVVKTGEKVVAKVLEIKREKGKPTKISLSLKQAKGDPWEQFIKDHAEGGTYSGKVVSLAPFGAFVQLMPGVTGLIHISEMSWEKRISRPDDVVQLGDTVSVTILSMDTANRKLSLSLKQALEDPWIEAAQRYPEGSIVEAKIESVTSFGVFAALAPGLVGLIPNEELTEGSVRNKEQLVGQSVKVYVLKLDETARRLSLSVRRVSETIEKESYRSYVDTQSSSESRPRITLGDLIKKKISEGK